MDVLLVSPRLPATDKRYCGEHTYTDTLLQYPPPGVRYYHYEDLMTNDQIRKIKWLYRIGPRLKRWGILPPDIWAEYLDSDFTPDIVHIHGFSAVVRFHQAKKKIPIVLSTSTGSYSDLKYYLGWDQMRSRRARWLKRQYLRLVDAHDSSLRPEKAACVLVWSHFAHRLHIDEGYVRAEQIEVLPPGLPRRDGHRKRGVNNDRTTFLFIGRDFERKNGQLVLQAFRKVLSKYPTVRLIIVGIPEDGRTISEPGVTHYHFLQRQDLLEQIYPQADILVLPSKAEGYGLVLLEAMSFGIPVIGVNSWAMAEVIEEGINGLLISPGEESELAIKMLQFVEDIPLYMKFRQESKRVFNQRFSVHQHNEQLQSIYNHILRE